MSIIELALLIAFFTNGLNVLFSPGQLLGFVGRFWDVVEAEYIQEDKNFLDRLTYWTLKPIIGCLWCMSSVWGITLSLILANYHGLNFLGIVISCIVAIPISQVVNRVFE